MPGRQDSKKSNQTLKRNTITTAKDISDEERINSYKQKIALIAKAIEKLESVSKKLKHGPNNNFGTFEEIIKRYENKDKKLISLLLKNGYTSENIDALIKFPVYRKWATNILRILSNSSVENKANEITIFHLKNLLKRISSFLTGYASVNTEINYFPY